MLQNSATVAVRLGKLTSIAFAVFIAIGGLILARHWPFSEQRFRRSLQETFPATVTFQHFRATYFPHPGCIAEGAVFKRLGTSTQIPAIVTVQRIAVEAHYLDILFRPGYLAQIVTEGFQVHVPPIGTKVEDTGWRATSSNTRVGKITLDGSMIEILRSDDHDALRFDIHTLKLKSVSQDKPLTYEVALHNPLPPGEIRAHGQFGPWNSSDPGETPVAGEYNFKNADLSVFKGIAGILSADDKFQGALKHIEANGSIDIPNFEVTRSRHSVHLTSHFHAFVDGTDGEVQLERVDTSFLKTKVFATGEIAKQSGVHGETASIDLNVSAGRIQDVLRLFVSEPKPPFNGTTSFRAHVILPPGKEEFLQKVRLSGDFGIAGGEFTKASTQAKVNDFSERARGEKPDDQTEDQDRVISDLSGHVELQNAIATFSNFSFAVPGASARMHGTYHLEKRTVDLHGTLKSEAELSKMSSGFKSVLLKPFDSLFKRKHAGAVLPVHLTGTYDDPQPGVDIIPKKSSSESSQTKNQ